MAEIIIDLYKTRKLNSGLGQFSMNFARELMSRNTMNYKIHFVVPAPGIIAGGDKIKLRKADILMRYFPYMGRKYDLWHSLNQFPSHFPNRNTPQILTVHDLNFLVEKNSNKAAGYLRKLQRNVDRADYLTAISCHTKKILEQNTDLKGRDVRVIYNGVSADITGEKAKPAFKDSKKYFFSIGIFSRKKNFHVLLPVMKHFREHQLIIAGDNKTSYGREIAGMIDRLGLNDRIILTGEISEAEKLWLYENCDAFLFPSVAEGFGLPVIEAMNFGKPVFLNDTEVLREIGGEHAYFLTSFDDVIMSDFIRKKLEEFSEDEENIRNSIKQYAARFSWRNCMDGYIRLYEEVTGVKFSEGN